MAELESAAIAAFIRDWLADEANQPGWGTYVASDENLSEVTIDGVVNLLGLAAAIKERTAHGDRKDT